MKTLPNKYVITSSPNQNPAFFLKKMEEHMINGVKLIQLRAKELNETSYISLAKSAITLSRDYHCTIIVNTTLEIAEHLNADGVHLSSEILLSLKERPIEADKILSVACHNQAELIQAQKISASIVTVSPVLPTLTHPNMEALGWARFSELCQSVTLPIYALGGMKAPYLKKVHACGGYGVAGISSFWDKIYA